MSYIDVGNAYLSGSERQILTVAGQNLMCLNEKYDKGKYTVKVIIEGGNRFYIYRNGKFILTCDTAMECYYCICAILQSVKEISNNTEVVNNENT